jgi:hypothetical protein
VLLALDREGHSIGSPVSLVGLSTDLVLKHGAYVPGKWRMLGVLDARPESEVDPANAGQLNNLEKAVANLAGTPIGRVTAQLSPQVRRLLGRPRLAFGMTPLLIFRGVSA